MSSQPSNPFFYLKHGLDYDNFGFMVDLPCFENIAFHINIQIYNQHLYNLVYHNSH